MNDGYHQCTNLAVYRYTWPGKNEAYICEEHVGKLRAVAEAMGMYLQITPMKILDPQLLCTQQVKENE